MRHAEIAKAPSELGKDADKAQRLAVIIKRIKETNAQGIQRRLCFARAAQHRERDHRHHHQGDEHHKALHKIRPAHGKKAAEKRVDQNDSHTNHKSERIIQPEYGGKQLSARRETGGRIN